MTKKLKPVHPGEILREEFMVPLGLSMNRVAMALRVPVKLDMLHAAQDHPSQVSSDFSPRLAAAPHQDSEHDGMQAKGTRSNMGSPSGDRSQDRQRGVWCCFRAVLV
jgi:hypothetical protein